MPSRNELITLQGALSALGLDALAPALCDEIECVDLAAGDVLSREGEKDEALFLLLEGRLDVLRVPDAPGGGAPQAPSLVATLSPPQLLGEMQLFNGGVRTATLRAAGPCKVGRLGREAFDRLSMRSPEVVEHLARRAVRHLHRDRLRSILSSFLGTSDAAVLEQVLSTVEWLWLRRGDVVVREGETGTDVFLLVDGRLRAAIGGEQGKAVGELLPGESVGETQLFTGGARNATVFATRDSTLARLSRESLTETLEQFPRLAMRLASIAVQRSARISTPRAIRRASINVVLRAGGPGVAIPDVAASLLRALAPHGRVAIIDRGTVGEALRRPELCDAGRDDPRAARLSAWLSDLEAQHEFLLFVPDGEGGNWTERCLRHSDIVLTVARAESAPGPAFSVAEARLSRHWLVLLHGEEHRPGGAAAWRERVPLERLYHVREGATSDLARLARAVAGREIGLVLGGGGARGYAHLGLLRSLDELGIPIDVLGGTSVGACVSGFYAVGKRGEELESTFRKVLGGRNDYTLPVVSVLKGRLMYQRMRQVLGDLSIEDLPVPIFCVASDITRYGMLVLDHGPLAPAVMASSCLPAIFPPVNVQGRWVVDGALVNGVPIDVMRARVGPNGIVIASVASGGGEEPELRAPLGAQTKSGWTWLLRKVRGALELPVVADVITRAAAAAGDHQLQAAIEAGRPDVCIRHDTGGHSAIDFGHAGSLLEKGYTASIEALRAFREQGLLPP